MALCNKGDAQAVRTSPAALPQKGVKSGILFSGKINRLGRAGITELQEQGFQSGIKRDLEISTGIVLIPLGVNHCDLVGAEVDIAKLNRRFAKSAASKKLYFKNVAHPSDLVFKFQSSLRNILVSERYLSFLWRKRDLHSKERISVSGFAPDCLCHNLAPNFEFKPGGIVPGRATIDFCLESPFQVVACVLVFDLAREKQPTRPQEGVDGMPDDFYPPQRSGALSGVKCGKVARNPIPELAASLNGRRIFINAGLSRHALRLPRVFGTINAKAGGLLSPFPFKTTFAKIPKRRASFFPNVRHESKSPTLSHARQDLPWKKEELPRSAWACCEPLRATVTLRGNLKLVVSDTYENSLPLVSQNQLNRSTLTEAGQ